MVNAIWSTRKLSQKKILIRQISFHYSPWGAFYMRGQATKRSNGKRKQEKIKYNSAVRLETLRSYKKL